MAWTYLAASEDSQKPWSPGCGQLPTVKETDTAKLSFSHEWPLVHYQSLLSGTMLGLFQETSCPMELRLYTEVFLAKTFQLQDAERAWRESEAAYFSRSLGSLAKYDRASSSWKTSQQSAFGEETLLPKSWPACGMTVDGLLYQLQGKPTSVEKGGFSWLRPCARDWKGYTKRAGESICNRLKELFPDTTGKPHPEFLEQIMGYPVRWTELEPWAMLWFRNRRKKRSKD